jgi:cell division protein FtsI (penicillin-binding protein 3)
LQYAELKIKKNLVPDVVGMGARDAVYLLETAGLKVKLTGIGKVVRQSLPPGSRANGQHIGIILN